MKEVHGINCKCCEPKSLEAQLLYEEVATLLTKEDIGGERADIIATVKEYQEKLAPVGDISELVKLTEALFTLPPGEINFAAARLADKEKRIQGFKMIEISEHPDLDLTNFIDFTKINLSKFQKLKIAVTIPTIDAVLRFGIGILGISIRFKIGLDTFSWAPDVSFPNSEEALQALKGLTYDKIVAESEGKKIDELKKLAQKQFSKNPEVLSALTQTTTSEEFFAALVAKKTNLVEEVDVQAAAENLYREAKEALELEISDVIPEGGIPDPEFATASDIIEKIDPCPDPTLQPAAYTPEEIQKVHDQVCETVGKDDFIDAPTIEIPDVDLPNQEDELKKVEEFLSEVDLQNKQMQECAKEKNELTNRWYFFYEHREKNKITKIYFSEIQKSLEKLNRISLNILTKRDDAIQRLVKNADGLNDLFKRYNQFREKKLQPLLITLALSIFPEDNDAFSVNPRARLVNQAAGDNDPTGGASTIEKLTGKLKKISELSRAQKAFLSSRVEQEYEAYLEEYETLKDARNSIISEIEKYQQEYSRFRSQELGPETLFDVRNRLLSENNTVSNLVGYFKNERVGNSIDSLWQIKVPENIVRETKELWRKSTDAVIDKKSGIGKPLENYIILCDLPKYSGSTIIEPRKGALEDLLWNPFYSSKRVDYFFSYSEQGYNQPKPEYGEDGRPLGGTTKKTIKNGLEEEIAVDVPTSMEGLDVNMEQAEFFLQNFEKLLKEKVEKRSLEIKQGETYSNYISRIQNVARIEGAIIFFSNPSTLNVLGNPSSAYTPSDSYRRNLQALDAYDEELGKELSRIEQLQSAKQACVDACQQNIESAAKKLVGAGGADSESIRKECKEKLGKDPVGQKQTDGRCPGPPKNCYWKEYTKIMQKISMLPIPELDPNNLPLRIFRYYPVSLIIPVAPAVFPSLSIPPIPQPAIYLPLPFLWKHIITLNTPLGVIVIWIALAGPVPNPYIMLIDEKGKATFMFTPFGPCSIPHPTVGGTVPGPDEKSLEETSLLDIVLPKDKLKIDLSSPLGKLLVGSKRSDSDDPDTSKNIIEKFKEKIKSSFSQLEISDPPSIAGNSAAAVAKRKKIREAFEKVPPNPAVISDALDEVFEAIQRSIKNIKVSSVKFPKDDKKLTVPTLGPGEIIDNLLGAVDTAASAPSAIANQVLKELGVGIKTINPVKKIKTEVLQEVNRPEIKKFFRQIDREINDLETKIASFGNLSPEEKIKRRAAIIKKIVKRPLQKVADQISPEKLGFVSTTLELPALPFPCYENIQLEPIPPYIYAIIAIIKSAPSIIDAVPAESIANLVSFEIDLSRPLPNAQQLFYGSINGVLGTIPEVEIPDIFGDNMYKQTLKMTRSIIKKFKIRLPKPGLPTQITIPGSLIKSIIVQATGLVLNALKAIIMAKIAEALEASNEEEQARKIIAVFLVINALFGVALSDIKGSDIKAFIGAILKSNVYPALDELSTLANAVNALGTFPFLSIIKLFQFPPKIPLVGGDGPYIEVGTALIKPFLDPIIYQLLPPLFDALPLPAVLIAASFTPTRLAFTKIHPLKAQEIMPVWESLSEKNVPFVIWLDQLIATAQRKALLASAQIPPFVSVP